VKGRSYWRFQSDPDALFVCLENEGHGEPSQSTKWHRFSEPETIASLMVGLGKDEIVKGLKRAFPKAEQVLKSGLWSELLLKRKFPMTKSINSAASTDGEEVKEEEEDEEVSYVQCLWCDDTVLMKYSQHDVFSRLMKVRPF
jgi:hypothetical protein